MKRSESAWHQATSIALAVGVGAFLLGSAPLESVMSSAPADSATRAITADPGAAKAAREAKKRERAEAREAKKKERAAKAGKSDDRLAKAKSSKSTGGSSVDLGDDDPLEGL